MKKKKKKIKKSVIINIILSLVWIFLIILNSYIVFKFDILPTKYLTMFIFIVDILPILFMFFMFKKNIIKPVKIFSYVVCGLSIIILSISFFYLNKTYSFIDSINDELVQKEDYYVKVLDNSKIENISDLKDKKIGIYKNSRYDDLLDKLKKKVSAQFIDYDDPVKLFEDLQDGDIDAVVLNDTIYELLQTELSYLEISLKNVETISVPLKKSEKEVVKIVDVTNTPFNIYVAGGDAYGSIDKVMNTDVNMIVSINPKTHEILLTSIPRDYYVLLPGQGENAYDKLTHAGYYGVEESILAVEKLLDIDINYYAKINFSTIEKIVDAIGGIDVDSDFNFCQDGSKTMCYKKGINHLTKDTVLPFARERHAFQDGDIQRVKNQQKVLEAIIAKVTSSKTLISSYTKILDAVSENFSTNLDTKSISRLVKLQLNDMPNWKIENQNLEGVDGMGRCYSIPNMDLYVMKRNEDSVNSAKEKIKAFLEN